MAALADGRNGRVASAGRRSRGRGGPRRRRLVFEPLEARRLLTVDLAELARLLPTADAADTQHALDGFGISVAVDADTAVIGAYSDAGERPIAGAAYVYTRSSGSWTLQQKLTASDAQLFDQFGYSVAISGDTILVGSLLHDSGGLPDTGAAYVFTRSGEMWSEQQKLLAADAATGDLFGGSLAIDGDTAVVGAFSDDTAGGVDAGSAYVFVRSGGTWTEQQKLTAPDGAAGDAFGLSLALEGNTLIAGAYQKDLAAGADAGAAYAFGYNGTSWSVQQTLTSPTAAAGDGFGSSVALGGDVAVIGAYSDDTAGGVDAGSAAVWTRSGSAWTQQQQLFAADAAAGDGFGISVRTEAGTILVGAHQDDTAAGADSGSLYVFTESSGSWTQQQQLTAAGAAEGDAFGFGLAISGTTVLVGAFRDDTEAGTDAGSAYFFTWDGAVWNQSQQVRQTDQDARNDMFGTAVSLDNDTLLIGAPRDDVVGLDAGAAYVFVRSGASWVLQQKLTAPAASPDERFGSAVSLRRETLVVGAPQHDIGSSADAGAVYVFARSGSSWTHQQTLSRVDAAAGDQFGAAVALGDGTLIAGAPGDDTSAGVDAGSAYVFEQADGVWTQQQKLTAADGAGGAQFGQTVAHDADTALIGAPFADLFASRDAGSAYVFVRSGMWTEQQKLVAPVPYSAAAFGSAVALRGDLAVVSADGSDVEFVPRAGTVYTFSRGGSQWSQQQQLAATDPASYDRFGRVVALGQDLLVVGSDLRDTPAGTNAGSVFVFTWNDGRWAQQQELRGSGGYVSDSFGSAVALSGLTLAVGAPLADLAGGNSGAAYVFGPDDQAPPTVGGTLPSITSGGRLAAGTRTLTIQFSEPVLGAGQSSSYRLQSLGPDALLGTADDTVLPVTAAWSETATVLSFPALPESVYRLTVRGTITDAAGNLLDGDNDGVAGGDAEYEFVAVPSEVGVFASSSEYPVGAYAYPTAIAAVDFSGDGIADLAAVDSTGRVALALGDGAGGFAAVGTFPSGGSASWSVAAGDFNGDGNSDLVAANTSNGSLGMLLGNGRGGFTATANYASGGAAPWDVTVGDFDGDGHADLAAANAGNVGVLLGNGMGGFGPSTAYASGGSGARAVCVGDFDGDGNADLVVANSGSNNVGILLGAGGFNVASSYASGGVSSPAGATGDFDSDGRDDFAAVNYGSAKVGVFLNARQYHPGVRELQAPGGIRFAVQARGSGAGQLVSAAGNRLEGAGRLEVSGQTYAPRTASDFLTDGGHTVVTPTAHVAGLYVHREIMVPTSGSDAFARTVDVFTNPTDQPISTTVQLVSNVGSDGTTTVWKTSDGDTEMEPADQWIGTDDADGAGTPAVVHLLHGPAGLAPRAVGLAGDRGDNLQWTYEITIPAGETLRLAHFTVLAETRAAAEAAAATLVTPDGFGGQAAAFMAQAEQDALVNFSFVTASDLTIDADAFGAGDNTILLARSGDQLLVTIGGATALHTAADGVNSLTINGQAGNDTLTVDFSGGNPVPAGGLVFHGGDPSNDPPGDALVLDRGTSSGLFQTITHTLVSSSDGNIHLDPEGPGSMPASLITYSGLEPVSDNLDAADRIFSFAGGTETITLADAGGADGRSRITSTLGEAVTFADPTGSLTVDTFTGSGADTIQVEGLDAAFDADFIVRADSDDTLRFQTNPTDLGNGRVDLAAGNIRFAAAVSTTGAARLEALAGSILGDPAGFQADVSAATAVLVASGGIGEVADIQLKPLQLSVGSLEAASGSGALVLYNERALILGGVTDTLNGITSGRHIDIVADGDLLVSEPVTNTTGAGYTDLTGNTITIGASVATRGSDSLIVSQNGGDIVLNATLDSDAGTVQLLSAHDVTINGSILSQGAQVQLAAQNDVLFTASGLIDAEVSPVATQPLMLVDAQAAIWMADGARIDARDGQIYMTSVADMTIGSLAADWYVFLFSESGSILDGGDAHPDILSETAELIAGVGTADNPLETQLDELTADSPGGVFVTNAGALYIAYSGVRAAGDVQIAAGGALTLSAPVISDATVLLSSSGPIIDGHGETDDLVAAAAALTAAGGIGEGDAIETDVGQLAYRNTSNGNVEISNAAGLGINSVGPLTSSSNAGDTILLAAGPLTFATDSVQAGLSGRAVDSAADMDNVAVNAGVSVTATDGDIAFRAGDRIIISPTAAVQAAAGSGKLVFASAYADADGAGSMTLDGAISAGSTVTLNLNAASGSASQAGTGRITAAGLQLLSTGGGSFDLAASTSNRVAILAGNTVGTIAYRDSGDLAVGAVTTEGIATSGHAVTIHAAQGTITVDDPITTTPGTGGEVVLIGSVVVNDLLTPGAGTIRLQARTADILGRHVFYNHSHFDGNDPAANAQDDLAIAGDKTALLPGETAGFANYTSYVRGINGIMVDIAGLANAGEVQAGQFEFRAGNSGDPATWPATTLSGVSVRAGAGRDGSDRVTLIWPDGAIRKQWLQITVRADTVTGLAAPDVFYFGNAVAEAGNSPANAFVDGSDFAGARDNFRDSSHPAPVDFRFDYNRDSFVDGTDLAIARDYGTNFLTVLSLITAPAAAAGGSSGPAPWTYTSGESEAAEEPLLQAAWSFHDSRTNRPADSADAPSAARPAAASREAWRGGIEAAHSQRQRIQGELPRRKEGRESAFSPRTDLTHPFGDLLPCASDLLDAILDAIAAEVGRGWAG